MVNSGGAQRLFLHVGLPKSGTTFLQTRMVANRERLLDAGVLYPSSDDGIMFRASLEVRGSHASRGFTADRVAGSWERLVRTVRAHRGTSVISHEHFSGATEDQIAAAARLLDGVELHVVVTARDPVRQVPAMWQEAIKNGGTRSFEDFVLPIMNDLREGKRDLRFWDVQDLTGVLRRWGTVVPQERLHVVTADGSDPLELWRRFAGVIGFDPEAMSLEGQKANASLGTAQVALLRDVNVVLDGRIRRPHYDRVAKRLFAQGILARQLSASRPVLPPDMFDPLRALAESWRDEIEASDIQVHGDLEDLIPSVPPDGSRHPDDVSDAELYAAARDGIAELLVEMSRLQRMRQRRSGRLAAKRLRKATPPSVAARVRRVIDRVR